MSKINRIPKGLQDLFGNAAAGQNPADLLQQVRPTIDLTQLWSVEQTKYKQFVGQFGAVFQQQVIRVPEGELWIPISMSADVTTANVGESIQFVIGVADISNLFRIHLAQSPFRIATTAVETNAASFTWNQIQPLTGGEYVYAQCHQYVSALARNLNIRLKYILLKI